MTDAMPREGLVSFIDQHGLQPTLFIDHFGTALSFPKPAHALQLRSHAPQHWDMRKNDDDKPRQDGKLQVRATIIKPKDAPKETGNDAATSDTWRLTAHDLLGLKDGKRVISPTFSISDWLSFIKANDAQPIPGTYRIEFGLDFIEAFSQDDYTRAYLLCCLLYHLKHAQSLGSIRAINARGRRPKEIKTFEHAVRALMDGHQLMIGDREKVQYKAYIKRTDSVSGNGQAPLPPHMHRARIEIRMCDEHCPVNDPEELRHLPRLAKWFALFAAKDAEKTSIKYGFYAASPASKEPPKDRKKPAGYCAAGAWNERIRGRCKRSDFRERKINLKTPATEGKRPSARPAALITGEATNPPPPRLLSGVAGHEVTTEESMARSSAAHSAEPRSQALDHQAQSGSSVITSSARLHLADSVRHLGQLGHTFRQELEPVKTIKVSSENTK